MLTLQESLAGHGRHISFKTHLNNEINERLLLCESFSHDLTSHYDQPQLSKNLCQTPELDNIFCRYLLIDNE